MSETVRECFTCSKIGYCTETSCSRILSGYVCPLFAPVAGPVVQARSAMFHTYGPTSAARALLRRPTDEEQEECISMSLEKPPQGTTYSERKKQLEIMSFMDVRVLGAKTYKYKQGNDLVPVLDWDTTLQQDRKTESIEKVLQFELANGLIIPDGSATQSNQQQPQGVVQMAQQPPTFPPNGQPPQMPPAFQPPQMPMPQGAPPVFQPQGMPQMPQQGVPFGMQPGPQMGPPPMPPPPPMQQPPQQEAAPQAVPATGGKKKRGAAAAPPPAMAPQGPPQAAPQQFVQPPPQQQMPQQGTWSQAPGQAMAPPPQFQPAPMQAQPGFTPPQMPAQPQPVQFGVPQAAPQAQAVDLSPVLQLVDTVGKAVNNLGAAEGETGKQILAALAEVKGLLNIQLVALHHLYITNASVAQQLQGKDVGDASKFAAFLAPYAPR